MRVLLVKVARALINERNESMIVVSPPLGILHLASYLREFRGDEVQALDLRLENEKEDQDELLKTTVLDFQPHVVGLSVLTHEHLAAVRASQVVRSALPSAVIIAGGPHPTMYPRRTLQDENLDYIVCGEGEETLGELLGAIEKGDDTIGIKGVGGRQNGQVYINPQRIGADNLDAYPMPAWDLYDPKRYQYIKERMTLAPDFLPYAAMTTTRGCPYNCTYCHNIFGKRLRKRSVDHVLAELEYLKSLNIRSIEFYDDAFNVDRNHMRGILDEIIRRGLKINLSFPNALRADLLTEDDIRLLKRAGTYSLALAVETASPRLQKLIKKNLNIPRVTEAIRTAVKLRIFTTGYFMIGFPTETREEIEATIDYACRSLLHSALFFTVIPHPATELGRTAGLNELDAPIEDWNYMFGFSDLTAEPAQMVNYLQRKAFR